MSRFPCSTPPLDCPNPVLLPNADTESADPRIYYAKRFFLDYSQVCASLDPIVAGVCTDSAVGVYSNNEQTCVIDCSGTPVSFTAPSGTTLGLTQAEADAAAYAIACQGAIIVCGGGSGTLFPNEAQTCNTTCPDGTPVSATVPAGSIFGFSQAEANALAFTGACQVAAAQCPASPPPQFGNSAVYGTSDCPDGGTFSYLVPANTFFAPSQAEANATALSYANQQAVLQRSCLKNIQDVVCGQGDTLYHDVIVTKLPGTLTWSITSGSPPAGITFNNGVLSGTPFTGGASTFTVLCQSSNGNFITRTYTITVIRITPSVIPDGEVGVPFSYTIGQTGATSPVWTSSALPSGLTLNSSTGEISGTPTESETNPNLFITLTQGVASCTFQFSIEIVLNPMDWWKLDEAGSGDRIGSLNSIHLPCKLNVTSVAGGKYGNATALNSTSTSDSWCGNGGIVVVGIPGSGVPVTGMAYAGNGIDAFIWLDNPAGLINSDTLLLLKFCDSSGTEVWSMRFTIDNQVGVEFEMTGGTSGNIPLATSTAYRFFELYYDPSLTRLGFRINNGAVMDQWITVAAPPATAKGAVYINYDRRTAGSSNADICELAVYPAVLNSTQRAYLYNGSLGRTWPVVLP